MAKSVYIALVALIGSCMFLSCGKNDGEGTFTYRGAYHFYSATHSGPELIETRIDTTLDVTVIKTKDSVSFSSLYFNGAFAKNNEGIYDVGHNGDLQRWGYKLTSDSLKYYYNFSAQVGGDVASGYFYGKVQ